MAKKLSVLALEGRPEVLLELARELRNVVLGCSEDVQLIGRDGYLIKKQWRVTTDLPSLADRLSRMTCDGSHTHSSNFDLKGAQHYPVRMCRAILETLP